MAAAFFGITLLASAPTAVELFGFMLTEIRNSVLLLLLPGIHVPGEDRGHLGSSFVSYTTLYHNYFTVLYHTLLYFKLYCTILYHTVPYCTILRHAML